MNNAVVKHEPKAPLVAGGEVAAIIPRSIEEVFRLAGAMVASNMAPTSLKTAEQVTVAILAGAELGLPPFQAVQSFAVINGRPAIWGDGMIAVVRSNGFKIKEWMEGEGDDAVAWCTVTRPDNNEEITRSFSVADARKANLWGKAGPWQTNPKRMLQMRARGFACRDGAADVLRGFQLREEVEDYQPIRQANEPRTDVRARLEARGGGEREGFSASFDPEPQPETAEFAERAAEAAETVDAILDGDNLPDHEADTGEIIEMHLPAEDEGEPDNDFPGDRPSSTQGRAVANNGGAEGGLAGPDFDAVGWSVEFAQAVHKMTTVAEIRAAWAEVKAKGYPLKLKAVSAAKLQALTDSMDARVAEIEGGE